MQVCHPRRMKRCVHVENPLTEFGPLVKRLPTTSLAFCRNAHTYRWLGRKGLGLRNEQYRLFLLPPIPPHSSKTCRWLRTKTWRGTWGAEANAAEAHRYIMCLICFPSGYVEARSEGKYRDIMMYPPRPLVMGRICVFADAGSDCGIQSKLNLPALRTNEESTSYTTEGK